MERVLDAGAQPIGEFNAAGARLRRYVPGAALDDYAAAYEGAGTGNRRWPLTDQLGSVVALSDGTGAAIQINRYDEYGVPAAANAGRFGFTGQMWTPEAGGTYHYRARQYHPGLGRFLQTDPIGYAAGMNLYAYVNDDPVNFVDPLGRTPYVPPPTPTQQPLFWTCHYYSNDAGYFRWGGCVPTYPDPVTADVLSYGYEIASLGGAGGESAACLMLRNQMQQTEGGASPTVRNGWQWSDLEALAFFEHQAGREAALGERATSAVGAVGLLVTTGDAIWGPQNLSGLLRGIRAGAIGGAFLAGGLYTSSEAAAARRAEQAYRARINYLSGQCGA